MTDTLTATKRTESGTRACKAMRALGKLPAVVYGGAEKGTTMVSLDVRAFEKVWRAAGENTVVTVTGLDTEKSVLISDVAVDALSGTPIHADLLAVRTDVAVEVAVPLVFEGVAPAEKELGGTLMKVMHDVEVSALPKDLPQQITVDISPLATFDDQLLVKDLALPVGVTAVMDAEEVVALVNAPREEEEIPTEAPEVGDVEVEKKGKEESDEQAPASE